MNGFLNLVLKLAVLRLSRVISLSTGLEFDSHDSMKLIIHTLTQRLAQLEADVSACYVNDRLSILERELQQVKDENILLRNKLLDHERTLEHLKLRNTYTENYDTQLIHQNKESEEKILSSSKRAPWGPKLQVIESGIARNHNISGNRARRNIADIIPVIISTSRISKRETPVTQVAFFVQITPHHLEGLGIHHVLIFDKVVTNVGNAYHPHTGIFIAPLSGLYVFHVSALLIQGVHQRLELMRDGVIMQLLYINSLGKGEDSASVSVVFEVNKGSEVWVQTGYESGIIQGDGFTVFTGWLLLPF